MARDPRQRAEDNIAAIELLYSLHEQQRWATPEEQQVLAKYSSWGGVSALFDRRSAEWAELRDRLRKTVDDRTYRILDSSTTTAFFTPEELVRPMWDVLAQAGITEEHRVLEPGAGTGNFISNASRQENMIGVEQDPISAGIARQLYPTATIMELGYENVDLPKGTFQAAIGNVPFENRSLNDPKYNRGQLSIHNHFITKTLEMMDDGGVFAVITSTYTADAANTTAREAMINQADLIGAVRLPSGAFQANAGTGVTSDILLFRKRPSDQAPSALSDAFIETKRMSVGEGEELRVNGVFVDRPWAIAGTPSLTRNQFGKPSLHIAPDSEDVAEELKASFSRFIDEAASTAPPQVVADFDLQAVVDAQVFEQPTPGTIRYIADENSVQFQRYSHKNQAWVEVKPPAKAAIPRWTATIDLMETAKRLQEARREGDESGAEVYYQQLVAQHETFVERWGALNTVEEKTTMRAPSKKQQELLFKEREQQWRKEHMLVPSEPLPENVEQQLRSEVTEKQPYTKKKLPYIDPFDKDPRSIMLLGLDEVDASTGEVAKKGLLLGKQASSSRNKVQVSTLEDAIAVSISEYGVIDPAGVADALGRDPEDVVEELVSSGQVYRDPADPERLMRRETYLSGNVRTKLEEARAAVSEDPRLQANVDALKEVIPEQAEQLPTIRPGTGWVDKRYYEQYLIERLGAPKTTKVVRAGGSWTIDFGERQWNYGGKADLDFGLVAAGGSPRFNYRSQRAELQRYANQGLACTRGDGVVIPAFRMFQNALNLRTPEVRYGTSWATNHPSDKVSGEATRFATRKWHDIQADFSNWLLSDPDRYQELLKLYNEKFRSHAAPKYDGSGRKLPGCAVTTPYAYQKNAVERIINEPGTLLNHCVGAGKTGTMFMAAMELKRLGKAQQPWIVVPNHIASQVVAESQQWYPEAKVLTPPENASREDKIQFVSQAMAEDWDFVIVSDTIFKSIDMSTTFQQQYLQERYDELDQAYQAIALEHGVDSPLAKRARSARKNIDKRLTALKSSSRIEGLDFDATPADYLFIDEAHEYKNLDRQSAIADMSIIGSQKATDLDMKLSYLRQANNTAGKNVETTPVCTLATGTPIANNVAEIWVMQHYLRPDLARSMSVASIDQWAAMFSSQSTEFEINAQNELVSKNRTRGYSNVADLQAIAHQFTDTVYQEQIEHRLPMLSNDGRPITVSFSVGQEARDFMRDFKDRLSPQQEFNPARDSVLKILTDGRKVAISPRLVHLDIEGASPRAKAVAENVLATYHAHKDDRYLDVNGNPHPNPGGLQIAFLDSAVPTGDGSYSLYQEIKDLLVEQGMNPDRIEFAQDHVKQREALYKRCRNGEVDLLIGSTRLLGTGVNIQDRVTAIHHVDLPWRPADLEQRNGRGIRKGNQNLEMDEYHYIAEGTADAVSWQAFTRKLGFINDFFRTGRVIDQLEPIEDSSEEVAAMHKAIATGDQRYVTLHRLEQRRDELVSKRQEWQAARQSNQSSITYLRSTVATHDSAIGFYSRHIDSAHDWLSSEHRAWANGRGEVFTTRIEAATSITSSIARGLRFRQQEPQTIAVIAGVEFEGRYSVANTCYEVYAKNGPQDMAAVSRFSFQDIAEFDENTAKRSGALKRLENKIESMPSTLERHYVDRAHAAQELSELEQKSAPNFAHTEELAELESNIGELRSELVAKEKSGAAIQDEIDYKQRCAVRGRGKEWSLELNPTKAYVEERGKATVNEVVLEAKTREADCLQAAGEISKKQHDFRVAQYQREFPVQSTDEKALYSARLLLDKINAKTPTAQHRGRKGEGTSSWTQPHAPNQASQQRHNPLE
ncbi:helicase-related protein [Corynebacterium sp. 11A]|uniref:helicase-related protein n=1 Tax=Corynebacterium sp. 11A TaxID=2080510 RepID=UPI00124E67CA|nr:helicase-related protein [Corynebacterium sp. 11A]